MGIEQTEKQFLKNYNIRDYDVPLATVDMAIFTIKDDQLHVLLVKRAQHPYKGWWALPGGFVDVKLDKALGDTARRKLKEKTGISTPYLEQVETVGNGDRDPRGWSITMAYFALLPWRNIELVANSSSEEIKWISVDQVLDAQKLAFDHAYILKICVERLRSKVQYTSIAVNLMAEEFSLAELQTIFEIILEKPIEKKSFRRRLLDVGILEETGNVRLGSNRPAKLYRVKAQGESYFFSRALEGPRE